MSNPVFIRCLVHGDTFARTFEVQVQGSDSVTRLKTLIKNAKSQAFKDIDADELELYKVDIEIGEDEDTPQAPALDTQARLRVNRRLMDQLPTVLEDSHIYILVKLPAPPSAPPVAPPTDRIYKKLKRFSVNGTIQPHQYADFFVVDQTKENEPLIQHILTNQFVSFHAPRAAGKSTRMLQLANQLERGIQVDQGLRKFECFYVDFQLLALNKGEQTFWSTFGAAFPPKASLPVKINCLETFIGAFKKGHSRWNLPVVLLFDEFDSLLLPGSSDILSDCLRVMRGIKNNIQDFIIDSIIVIGTFGVVMLNQENPGLSPFNTSESIQGVSLSYTQAVELFKDYACARNIGHLDPRIVDDIYSRTNGHAGLLCLCGRAMDESLGGYSNTSITFESWQRFAVTRLQHKVLHYRTIDRLVKNLGQPQMKEAVAFMKKRFLANPDPIRVRGQDVALSMVLAKEGALNATAEATFVIASSLLRSLIMIEITNKLLPCPTTIIPLHEDNSLNIFEVLKTVVPLFHQQDINSGSQFSYKTAAVKVNTRRGQRVPRESVYQQQLVGIFQNWLHTFSYDIIGQYHTKDPHGNSRYCDIVLTAPDTDLPGPTAVLELLATSTEPDLKEHYKRALEYADSLQIRSTQQCYIRDIWVVHFTCEDHATRKENCRWPTEEGNLEGSPRWPTIENLNVAVFWHDCGFTKIRMSARWKGYGAKAWQEIYDQPVRRSVL